MTSSTAATIRVEVGRTLDALVPYAAAWNELAAALPQVMPMLSHTWVATWFDQELGPDERLLVLLAHDGDPRALRGVLPVVLAPKRVFGVRRTTARVPLAYVTENGDALLRPGGEQETLRALLRALRVEAEPPLFGLTLGAVRDDSPTTTALEATPPGWVVQAETDTRGSSLVVDGTADAWEASLGRSLRKDLRAGENKAQREGLVLRYECLEGARAVPEHLDELVGLEASGWKGREGTAIASKAQSRAKYRALAAGFHAEGRLEWHLLHLGDRLAAARMAVRYDHGLMLLRSAYADDLKRYQVGHLSLRAMVRREHERGGGGEINLVTDWPWCRRWGMRQRPYLRVLLAPRRPLPLLAGVLPAAMRGAGRRVPGLKALRDRMRGGEERRAET